VRAEVRNDIRTELRQAGVKYSDGLGDRVYEAIEWLLGDRERLADAMRERMEALAERDEARAQVARVRAKAEEWAALAPEGDWGDSMDATITADMGRAVLALLNGTAADSGGKPDA
jgi:DNA-binding SARP family transcriptional activator